MIKTKLGRVLFRKIGGRIVPIRISNVADKIADASSIGNKTRKIIATGHKGGFMGQLTLQIPKKGNKAYIQDVRVPKEFRRKGISKSLFARATKFLQRANFRFLRSSDLQHPAQVNIRRRAGVFKAGPKRKARSRFFADQFGQFGEDTRRVTSQEAKEILKNNPTGRLITSTTMLKQLPKKYRK